jgi:hypothetical protein
VFVSLCYMVIRRVLQLLALRFRSNAYKELEIVVLRHEVAILRRRTRRPAITAVVRLFLAIVNRLLPRARRRPLSSRQRRASMASALGGEALDVPVSHWSPADAP